MRYLALGSLLLLVLAPAALAAEAAPAQPVVAAKPAPKRTEAEQKKITEMRKRIDIRKTELNGSKWDLSLGSSDAKMKGKTDVFTFQDGMFRSDNLSKRGFSPTNYTVSVAGDEKSESAVWETMQTGKEGLIFIRGEWEKDRMQGNVTEQLDGGKKVVEYYFTTSAKKSIPPSSKKEPAPGEGAMAGPTADTAAMVSSENPSKKSELISNEQVVEPFVPGTTDELKKSGRG